MNFINQRVGEMIEELCGELRWEAADPDRTFLRYTGVEVGKEKMMVKVWSKIGRICFRLLAVQTKYSMPPRWYGGEIEITVDDERHPDDIVKDVRRRFINQAEQAFRDSVTERDKSDLWHLDRYRVYRRLVDTLQGIISDIDPSSRDMKLFPSWGIEDDPSRGPTIEVHAPDYVDLRTGNIPAELAEYLVVCGQAWFRNR